jgi:hypothetical protein
MNKYYTIFLLLCLFIMGCSSSYTIKDFSTKDKYYEDFNNSVKNKDMNITLINNSSFTLNDGAVLENDTLFSFAKLEEKNIRIFALSDITEIRYTNNDSSSASILFKNGEMLRGKNIRTNRDSIYFTVKTSTAKNNIAPIHIEIDKVKTVTYKTRLGSSLIGILSGAIAGIIVAVIAGSTLTDKEGSSVALNYDVLAPPIGAILGGIAGGLIGWNTIYQFNP